MFKKFKSVNKKHLVLLTTGLAFCSLLILLRGMDATQYTDMSQVKSNIETTVQPTEINEEIKTENIKTQVIENHKLNTAGWIPTWASESGLNSLKNNPGVFNTISPVWYEINSDGTLKSRYPANRNTITSYANNNQITIVPTIGSFDHVFLGTILSSAEKRTAHINSIVSTVLTNNYAGIDLDYESISESDEASYFLFLGELSKQLHKNNKVLSVTVLAKWGDNVRYSYKPETRKVQDWSKVAAFADEIRIMAYDYTHSSDYYPGPIGPTGWIRRVLDYAKTEIAPAKTVLGVHLYAYEWYRPMDSQEGLDLQTDPSLNKQENPRPARAYTYTAVEKILRDYQGEDSSFEGEEIFFYTAKNSTTGVTENRALVYISPDGVKERVNIAKEYGLKGVVFWRLGGENSILSE